MTDAFQQGPSQRLQHDVRFAAIRGLMAGMAQRFGDTIDPAASALKAVYGILLKQATTMAFGDAFALLGVMCAGAPDPRRS